MTKKEIAIIRRAVGQLRGWSWECQSDHYIPADNIGKRLQSILPKAVKAELKKRYE